MSQIRLADCEHSIQASDANLGDSHFNDVRLASSRFSQVTLEGSTFEHVHFDASKFDNVSFAGASIANGMYTGMTIEGIDVEALLAMWRSAHGAVSAPAAAH